ncbi:hypothetical protein [Streptomyces sp. Amel2xB2]|nr:hypothetical protein [Streptomyces sp. Amel2xB2]
MPSVAASGLVFLDLQCGHEPAPLGWETALGIDDRIADEEACV